MALSNICISFKLLNIFLRGRTRSRLLRDNARILLLLDHLVLVLVLLLKSILINGGQKIVSVLEFALQVTGK